MPRRLIRVLHIEDDRFQHRLLAHFLRDVDEFEFQFTCVEREEDGLESFDRVGADLIVLDYQLAGGDGLHCLQELRRRDANVPVIAVSGTASVQIVKELVECGADDYLDKKDLSSLVLAHCVRDVISRFDARERLVRRMRTDTIGT
jgi:DNA-binding response OmpR family regulator